MLDVNRSGRHFPEFYAALLLKRMLTDRPLGYVDLRSPAGIGLGALVYNYDGRVFASDEGRMLRNDQHKLVLNGSPVTTRGKFNRDATHPIEPWAVKDAR